MSEKHELEQNDALKDYYKEIGDGMEPPAHLVKAAKTGVFLNPGAKPSTHVWRFAKAVACYALGIGLFLGAIALLPRLLEGLTLPGAQVTTALTDGTDFAALSEELKAEIKEAYEKRDEHSRFGGWKEEGGSVQYYGTYNGCVVIGFGTDLDWYREIEVAETVFVLGSDMMLIYKDGEFKKLAEAYEDGWLSKENIASLARHPDIVTTQKKEELLKEEILKAYAKDRTDIDQISVQILAQEGDLCAVWIDDPNGQYLGVVTQYTEFGLKFRYGTSHQILIYKRGINLFYTIPEAAYYDIIISKEFVRETYIAYYFKSLDSKEKLYCTATVDDDFSENQIFVAVFPEFNQYPYTAEDFAMIGCTQVEEIAAVGDIGANGEISQYRFLLLTLNQKSKSNVLSAVKRLEAELDIYTAGPYGYEKTPDLPETPDVPPQPSNIEEEIARAYADRYSKDADQLSVRIVARDYRVEQKYVVVFVDDSTVQYEFMPVLDDVDGWEFLYDSTQTMLVYSDGAFYSIAEAYDKSIMDRIQLNDLYNQYKKQYSHLYDADRLQKIAEDEIKQLCPKRFGIGNAEDYSVRFVMTVGKGYVIYIDGPIDLSDTVTTQKICGLDFVYQSSQVMEFYKDGKFYSLPEAFESGLLHYMTIHLLYSRHNPAITEEIVRAHVATDDCDDNYKELNHMVRFVAKIGDRYAVFIDCPGVMYPQEEITVTINGLDFHYSDYHQMEIYHNGKLYSVQSAFEKGVLSENQLRYLYEIREGNYDYPYAE